MAERFVVDTSIAMAWCFKDENDEQADTILNMLQNSPAIVPSIWPLEVTNVLLVAERNKRLKRKDRRRPPRRLLGLYSWIPPSWA